ncbi:hypothetical protein O4J56_16925 [Nocardiopsis sp. RSe5-2]|uniref:Wadjet protein JetD C-terminal domain-containing protein n=1 Tax=Nocardiopsis endophytica TaxID=3018445 RepID=A0ABT4U5V5_9ACTN|nr:hypothetical protein [Nocardiopsis endophytica]
MEAVRLAAVLDPAGRGRRCSVDEVAEALRGLVPQTEPWAFLDLLEAVLRQGEEQGRWKATRVTVQRGRARLPKSILLTRRTPTGETLRPVDVPLRGELASWAADLPLSASQRRLLVSVNDWLRRTDGGDVPMAAAAERAYELLGDEKAFDSTPPRGGATLWRPDRLTFDLLRCERVATPLTWEPTGADLTGDGPMVCVENHATFRTLLRVLRERRVPRWRAVAWVQGRNTAPVKSVADLPFRVTRLDYLGDLDPAGLEIAATVCSIAEDAGVEAGPAAVLWRMLVEASPRSGPKVDRDRARRLAAWLPEALREPAAVLLTEGRAVPQEALRYETLVRSEAFNGE